MPTITTIECLRCGASVDPDLADGDLCPPCADDEWLREQTFEQQRLERGR